MPQPQIPISPAFRTGVVRFRTLLRLGMSTLHALRQVRPDIVHVHSSLAGVVVRLCLLPSLRRPKLIYTPHAWSFSPGAARHVFFRRLCERILALWTDRIICVSKHELKLAIEAGISRRRCAVVLTGLPEPAATRSPVRRPAPEPVASEASCLLAVSTIRRGSISTLM